MELNPRDAVAVLERTPATLRGMLAGLSDEWVLSNEGLETFSPRDVLGHLILGEETDWVPRMWIILREGESRPFTPFDRFGFRAASEGQTTDSLLERFAILRRANLREVASATLDAATLARTGMHPGLGRVTLAQLLAAWVVHDLGHVKQVARVMAGQYREAVGPWREYLTILDRP